MHPPFSSISTWRPGRISWPSPVEYFSQDGGCGNGSTCGRRMRSGHVEEVRKAVRNHFEARRGPDLIAVSPLNVFIGYGRTVPLTLHHQEPSFILRSQASAPLVSCLLTRTCQTLRLSA